MLMDRILREKLNDILPQRVLFDESMSHHTSIRVGGSADAVVFPESVEELSRIIKCLRHVGIPFIPLGNGTNVIIKDGGYRGAVICLKDIKNVHLTERGANQVSIYAEAGISLSEIVHLAAEESLTGMEFCAGIPGSTGGAVKMNAGAYGSEIKDAVEAVELIDNSGEIQKCKKNMLKFTYRNLDLPEGSVITSALFLLSRGVREQIQARITEILGMRKDKHPLQYHNAGSIFKNPKGAIPAGQIIDELRLKGVQIGDAKISEKHGNFIVNLGRAKASDIIALIEMVKKKVQEERGIFLETEVKIIGENG